MVVGPEARRSNELELHAARARAERHARAEHDGEEVDDQLVHQPRGERLGGDVPPKSSPRLSPAAALAVATASRMSPDRAVIPSGGS